MSRSLTAAALVMVALASAACGGASEGKETPAAGAAATDVVVVAKDVSFVDPPREIVAGTVNVALDNRGYAPHDITFEGPKGTVVAANGRSRVTGQVTLTPGIYVVYCSVPGHRQAGMEFEMTVR